MAGWSLGVGEGLGVGGWYCSGPVLGDLAPSLDSYMSEALFPLWPNYQAVPENMAYCMCLQSEF